MELMDCPTVDVDVVYVLSMAFCETEKGPGEGLGGWEREVDCRID